MEAKSQFTQLYFPRFVPLQHRSSEQAPSGHSTPCQRIWILMLFSFPCRGSPLSYNSETLPASLCPNPTIKSSECICERRNQENEHKSCPRVSPSVYQGIENAFSRGIMKACHLGAKIKSVSHVARYILDEIPSLTKECCRFFPLTWSI
jgi:hypothetical protein